MTFPNDFNGDYKEEPYNPPSNDWMQTFTGRAFFPLSVNVADINEYDIAHSLAFQCRYNGHTERFYSVAEHSYHMSYIVPPEDALWALLHDAPETYIGDMVRPLKKTMHYFREIDEKIMDSVCERFGLPLGMPDSVKEADNRIIENERLALLREPPYPWTVHGDPYPDLVIEAWEPAIAEFKFYTRLQELLQDREIEAAKKLAQMGER
jgi:hypothetical protein